MLSRSKKSKGDTDLTYRSSNLSKRDDAKKKQNYKILGVIGLVTFVLIVILYSNGSLSSVSSSSSSRDYIIGSKTQQVEEATSKILSAWGQQGEALKFSNLPSSGQGYLTVSAMVVQDDGTEKKQDVQVFYREASKLNPKGFGIASVLHNHVHSLMGNNREDGKHNNIEDYVVNKDITIILLHGKQYASSTWSELNTLSYFASLGYKIYAIDIPGYGHSQKDVVIKQNGWLCETIIKLVTSQSEEGNINEDGGEHKHNKINNKMRSNKNINKICIISPDFSGLYTLELLLNHQRVLGSDQGIEFVSYIPLSISTIFAHKLISKYSEKEKELSVIKPDLNVQNLLSQSQSQSNSNPIIKFNKLFRDNIVSVCSIGGEQDYDFNKNILFKDIPNSNTIVINGAKKYIYADNPDVFHDIIKRFLTTNQCSINPDQGKEI